MSDAVCFRCDWQGETSKPVCPNCGAPLYRPERETKGAMRIPGVRGLRAAGSRVQASVRRVSRKDTAAEAPEEAEELPSGAVVRRTPPWLILAVLAIAGIAITVVVRGGREEAPEIPVAATGRLVYAGPDRRLYVVDLTTGEVSRGPRVPVPSRLAVSTTGQDSVLVSTIDPNGRESVYLVADLDPGASPVFVAEGDLVTWDPGGRTVYALDSAPGPVEGDVCTDRHVAMFAIDVTTGTRERVYAEDIPCGGVFSLAAGGDSVFATRISDGNSAVTEVAPPSGTLALAGYTLISVSPSGELLVSPLSQEEGRSHSPTVLFRPLATGLDDVRLGPDGLVTERVLAWAGDSSKVAILGRVSAGLRVWMVDAGQGGDVREPDPVGPSGLVRDAAGAFDRNETLYLVVRGEVTGIAGDDSFRVDIDRAGAPPIAGPVAWLP